VNDTLAAKVKLFVALSPVSHMGNLEVSLFQFLAKWDAETLLSLFGFREFLPNTPVVDSIMSLLCELDSNLCSGVMCVIMGCNTQNWNNTRWPVYSHHDPAGTSVKNLAHYSQLVRSGNWEKFDYGAAKNMVIYGQKTPPKYNLGDLKVPVALFTGGQDYLADPKDVAQMILELPPSKIVFRNNVPEYSHIDPIWGINAKDLIYPDILTLLSKY